MLGPMSSGFERKYQIEFHGQETYTKYTDGVSLFANKDQQECPVTSCKVKQLGCQNDLDDQRLTVGSATPFSLEIK